MLDRYEIDMGIVVDDGEVDKLYEKKGLYSGEFVVVKARTFTKENLLENVIVSRVQKGGLSERYAREFKKAYNKEFVPKLTIPNWQVIMDLAVAGFGCALVPHFLCRDELKHRRLEIVKHKVKPIPFKLCAIAAKGRTFPKNAQAIFESFPER
jgi:DNA-binding transcriptional LysR family regulator